MIEMCLRWTLVEKKSGTLKILNEICLCSISVTVANGSLISLKVKVVLPRYILGGLLSSFRQLKTSIVYFKLSMPSSSSSS